jgi:hypothetical protein
MPISFTSAAKNLLTVTMDGIGLDLLRRGAGLERDALLQLARRVPHVCDAEDLVERRGLVGHEASDALDKDRGFPGARAGDHQHGAALVLDGDLLLRIGGE